MRRRGIVRTDAWWDRRPRNNPEEILPTAPGRKELQMSLTPTLSRLVYENRNRLNLTVGQNLRSCCHALQRDQADVPGLIWALPH